MRLLLQIDEEAVCSIPPQWTDFAMPDAEVVVGRGRAYFRVGDLCELARLIDRLRCRHEPIERDEV